MTQCITKVSEGENGFRIIKSYLAEINRYVLWGEITSIHYENGSFTTKVNTAQPVELRLKFAEDWFIQMSVLINDICGYDNFQISNWTLWVNGENFTITYIVDDEESTE